MPSLAWRLAAMFAVFVTLVAIRLNDHFALLPNPLAIELDLGQGQIPRSEPLIVSGEPTRGDFLAVRYVDATTVTFVYDSWGHAGIVSRPVKISPGVRLRLRVEMPTLDQVRNSSVSTTDRVRVTAGDTVVLDTPAHFYPREPERIFFAENPIGGSSCGSLLRGRIFLADDGRELRGTPNIGFQPRARLAHLGNLLVRWLRHEPRQVLALLGISVLLVLGATALRARGVSLAALGPGLRRHRWFVVAALVATLGFTWVVTLGTFRFDVREVFGNFYDYQAASLLAGRLDVPEDAIGGEAFEAQGKLYGYFGPTPALLRVPFVLAGLAFGKLSRAAMVLYFVASLVAAYLMLREGIRLARRATTAGGDTDDIPSPFAVCVLTFSAGWGSTIFFLGSRGLIFHEAILGGIAFALWSCWCSLRHLRAPGRRWWIAALVTGILSIHTRPPTGLFALTFLGCVCLALAWRDYRAEAAKSGRRWFYPRTFSRHAAVGALCAAGALSLNGLAYLKFGVFDAAPLRMSRPYAKPERLAHIDGKSFHAVNLPYNFYTYVVRPNFRVETGFPWIYLGSLTPGHYFPKAKIDLPDHTLAITYAMPSLFALATLGCLGAMLAAPGLRDAITTVWLASLPMTLALFAAVATAQRYTGDFCPLLISASALALAALEPARPAWRRPLQLGLLLATLAAIAVTVALTLHYQGETLWGVPEETRLNYQHLRQTIDHLFTRPPAK